MNAAPQETLTTIEAAKLLNASVRTIQLWVEDGRLKAWKTPGGHRRVLRSSVEEMLSDRHRHSHTERQAYQVLAVEDDPIQLKLLEKILTSLLPTMNLRVSSNGFEALIRIGEQRPDLLITDLMMPGLDGFRLLQTLERESTAHPMQIVVLTSLTPQEVQEQGGLPNGVTLLHKPLNIDSLSALTHAYHQVWQLGGR